MKYVLILMGLVFSSHTLKAQDSIYIWAENRTIRWDDFLGQVNDSSIYDAEAFAEVRYKYEFQENGSPKFEVFATFNRRTSWSKRHRQSESLLRHEQLHFDIAQLYALKLKEEFERYQYTDDFTREIQQIFNGMKAEYHFMQIQCDEATNHSLNKEKQAEWENFVSRELQKFNSYAAVSQVQTKK